MLKITAETAILLELCTAFLWGSWFQFLKKIGNYPMPAFMIWLYVFSNMIVWGVMCGWRDIFVPEGIAASLASRPGLAAFCMAGGALFGAGMQVSTTVMVRLGLVLSVSVTATLSIFTGTIIPMAVHGLPEGVTVPVLLLISLVFLSGTLLIQFGGVIYRRDNEDNVDLSIPKIDGRTYLLFLLNTVLGLGYTFAVTYGMRSVTNPDGLPPMLCCGMICLGALTGTLAVSGFRLLRAGELSILRHTPPRILMYCFLSACGHFGGNVTHMIAAPLLSLAIAWPITTTSGIWTYFWGFAYGEFRHSSMQVKLLIIAGVFLYLTGLVSLYLQIT